MSNRPVAKSAFEGLRPTILRQPSRSPVTAEAEARLLETSGEGKQTLQVPIPVIREPEPISIAAVEAPEPVIVKEAPSSVPTYTSAPLLQKKRREIRELVSFRLPLSLREKLATAAEKHEISQTDLICESIELNIQRYL